MIQPEFMIENGRKQISMEISQECRARKPALGSVNNAAPTAQTPPPAPEDGPDEGSPDDLREEAEGIESYYWRLLSAVMAWPCTCWGPQLVDYTNDNAAAIRQAVGLINQFKPPVMRNHTDDMDNQVGCLDDAVWEDSTDIPPGVSGNLEVSEEFDAKAAVGLRLGMINAGSLALTCMFELSHPDMEFEQFLELQGREVDGKVVRWLPVSCSRVGHFALVPAGADPNARPREGTDENMRTEHTAGSERRQEGIVVDGIAILAAICRQLGIEAIVAAGQAIPPNLENRLTEQIGKLTVGFTQFNALAADLAGLEQYVIQTGEKPLCAAEILKRLPARLELAAHGEAYLDALRMEAAKWYGLINFEKDKRAPTDREGRQIARIKASASVEELNDWIEEYRPAGQEALGPMRSTMGSDLPGEPAKTPTPEEQDIRDSASQIFKKGKKNG